MGHGLASALSFSVSFSPLCLRLFFNSLTHSVFFHFILIAQCLSCLMFGLFKLRYYLSFIYLWWNTGQLLAYLGGDVHTRHSYQQQPEYNYYYCYIVHLLMLFSFLIPTWAPTNPSVFLPSIPCRSFYCTD